MTRARPAEERFWSHVEVREPEECWLWNGGRNRSEANPYPGFRVDGRFVRASRFAYETQVGPIPDGMHVLHRCDNPPCCNGNHLFLGTQRENQRDCEEKGRRSHDKAWHPGLVMRGADHWSNRDRERFVATRARGDDHYKRRQSRQKEG